MRHLDMRDLWLQEELRAGRLTVETVSSVENVADVFTKALARVQLAELCARLRLGNLSDEERQEQE
eukprot:4997831-Heterocapsa_arctica.AAC.1